MQTICKRSENIFREGVKSKMHHSFEVGQCLLCDIKVKTAHKYFQDIWPALKKEFPHVHVSCGFRGASDQELAYQQGRSRLRWDKSDHNKTDSKGGQCARAIDLFFINIDGLAVFPPWQYLRVADWLEKNGYQIGSGIKWKKFVDGPHFYLLPSVLQP